MTKPSRTQHEKVREHLEKANNALKRSREKAQAGVAAHLASVPVLVSPPIESVGHHVSPTAPN
jgi:hypothetical protein